MKAEESISAQAVGEAALNNPGTRWSAEKIASIIGVRGVAGVVGGTKDGTKETFKEFLKGKFSLSDISSAIVIGAISNAFFIRFKNADFATKQHRIFGKFIEKSPKKGVKTDIKYAEKVLSKPEFKDFNNILKDIRGDIVKELKNSLPADEYAQLKSFIEDDNTLNEIIINQYLLEYIVNYEK